MKLATILFLAILVPTSVLAVSFTYVPQDPVKVGNLGVTFKLNMYLTNLEGTDQEFTIIKQEELPDTLLWSASLCVNGSCYAPFLDTLGGDTLSPNYVPPITVTAGDKDTVSVWVSTSTVHGGANVLLRAIPVSAPGDEKSQPLAAMTNGAQTLIVDDDGGQAYQNYYAEALPSGMTFARWPRVAEGPTATDLTTFGEVVWFTGGATPTLDAADRTALSTFLDGGGKLLLAGQDIAYSLCDVSSPEYSTSACQFVTNYLHASYGAASSGSTNVVGRAKDPIGDGLSFSIAGGAGNQSSPDGVTPSGGTEAMKYDGTAYSAAIHSFSASRRVAFFAFGLEGITSLSTRQTIIDRVFDYFTATVGVEGGVPGREILSTNRPNPFNPDTRLSVRLEKAAVGEVSILDAGGRHVRTLASGVLRAGETEHVWNGTDDRGADAPSGVYFVRLAVDGRTETRKVTLIR